LGGVGWGAGAVTASPAVGGVNKPPSLGAAGSGEPIACPHSGRRREAPRVNTVIPTDNRGGRTICLVAP
jgi:hypothetical protein